MDILRVLPIDQPNADGSEYDFAQVMLENLKTSGVQQEHKDDRIEFDAITPCSRATHRTPSTSPPRAA